MRTMNEKIYLAGRFSRRMELRQYAADLMFRGYDVTSRWLFEDHRIPEELVSAKDAMDVFDKTELSDESDPEKQTTYSELYEFVCKLATDDIADVAKADIVISFTEQPRTATRGGRHVELGIALALKKRIIVVGPREHIFHWNYAIEYHPTVEEWRKAWGFPELRFASAN